MGHTMSYTILHVFSEGHVIDELLNVGPFTRVLLVDCSKTDKVKDRLLAEHFVEDGEDILVQDHIRYIRRSPIHRNDPFGPLQWIDSDIVVNIEDGVTKLHDEWLDEILEPFSDDLVKMSYCDFISDKIPIFHTVLPSRVAKMPLCAFRKNVVQDPVPDLLQHMSGKVMSRYIPEILVEIDDKTQQ